MGFSVSGSFAILVLAAFMAFGTLYPATANGFEQVTDATHDSYEGQLDRQNTAINITINEHPSQLDVNVTNTGSTALTLNDTDVLVDGSYIPREDMLRFRVVGASGSELWLPGDQIWVRIQKPQLPDNDPNRVKVVTEYGVTDTVVIA